MAVEGDFPTPLFNGKLNLKFWKLGQNQYFSSFSRTLISSTYYLEGEVDCSPGSYAEKAGEACTSCYQSEILDTFFRYPKLQV